MKRMLASAWQENSAKMMRMMTVAHAADEVAQLTDAVCSSGVAAPAGARAHASAGPPPLAHTQLDQPGCQAVARLLQQ